MGIEKIRGRGQFYLYQDYGKLLDYLTKECYEVTIYDVNRGMKEVINSPEKVKGCFTLLKIKTPDGYHYEPLV